MKEPKLIKNSNNNKLPFIYIMALVLTIFIGSSYALLSSNHVLTKDNSEEAIVFKTGDLNLELTKDGNLELGEEYPKSDDEGKDNTAIKLTFTNTGTIDICRYEVKLVSDSESTLDSKYLKYIISEDDETKYSEPKNLDDTNIIYTGGKLKVGESKTIYIKAWIDELAGDEGLSKTYSGSFEADLYQGGCTEEAAGSSGLDVVKETVVAYADANKSDFNGGLVAINENGTLYDESAGNQTIREYRYTGLNVNNYIYYNCIDDAEQNADNCEVWRIIGIFKDEDGNEHLKIVNNKVLTRDMFPATFVANGTTYNIQYSTSSDYAYWNKKTSGTNNNDWATGGLQYWLNAGSDKTTKSASDGYMSYLSQNAKDLIAETKYYLGTVTYYDDPVDNDADGDVYGIWDTPIEAYKYERAVSGCTDGKGPSANSSKSAVEGNSSCRVWANNSATWTGNISLLYPSDYGYSANISYWSTKLAYNSFNKGAQNTSWLQKGANHGSYEWLLSPSSDGSSRVAYWGGGGSVYDGYVAGNFGVRASLNLKSQAIIFDGEGTSEEPYKVKLGN